MPRGRQQEDRLATYRSKRDFSKTREPDRTATKPGRQLVVQHHFATRDHFDLRLEIDGQLVSWAVTRGPSANPKDRRLAVRTEDHPLDYATFEGTIPKGQYGGGTVILWEFTTYSPANGDPAEALRKGEIKFIAHGERMRGRWVLVRMRGKEKRENWLLIKERDEFAEEDDTLARRFEAGVSSQLTRADIESGAESRVWSNTAAGKRVADLPAPAFIEPQLCGTAAEPPSSPGWVAEMKYDGYRLQIAVGGGEVHIYTRSGLDWTEKFRPIVAAARALKCRSALIDGEAVVFDAQGISDFAALVDALERDRADTIEFVAFDLLRLDGKDLRKRTLLQRKETLRELIGPGVSSIRYADHVVDDCARVFQHAIAAGAEGIVAKRAGSPYMSVRGPDWLKIKAAHRDDVLIVGFMKSTKGNEFASLIAAQQVGADLVHIGRIGTGYSAAVRKSLWPKLRANISRKPPAGFTAVTPPPRDAVYLAAPLRAEVAFGGWTGGGQLRHARFLGLSERQTPAPPKQPKAVAAKSARMSTPSIKAPAAVTHPERVVFPGDGVTKGDIAAYYERVADRILPYLEDRLVSIVRAPENIETETFFQRRPMKGMTVGIESVREGDDDYISIVGAAGLHTAAQFGAIEFHGWMSRTDRPDHPDKMVIDLDPAPDVPFTEVRRAAREIADRLADIGVRTWPMVTGGKGVHVVAPLDRSASADDIVAFSRAFARGLAEREPSRFIATMSKAKRNGRIFLDWMRNTHASTSIVPWSLRARAGAPVAAPLTWMALGKLKSGAAYDIKSAARLSDPWADFRKTRQAIPKKAIELAHSVRA